MNVKNLFFCLLMCLACFVSHAQTIDFNSCSDANKELKERAEDAEGLADEIASEDTDSEKQVPYLRSAVMSVAISASRVIKECGNGRPLSASEIEKSLIAGLLTLHTGKPETRARIEEIRPYIRAIAEAHADLLPIDYRMTSAVAEKIFRLQSR